MGNYIRYLALTYNRNESEKDSFIYNYIYIYISIYIKIYIYIIYIYIWDFPGSSASKESACNAEDSGLIPGLGRSPEEGVGYPLQYSWAALVAQTIKNLPAMRETWI